MSWRTFFRRFENPLLVVAGAASLTAILNNLEFNLLEANLYDFRMAHGIQPKADPSIVLITLDDATTKSLNEFSPLTLDVHVQFMEQLEKLHPKAVGYLVDMNRVAENNPELFHGEWGSRFVSAARRLESSGVPVVLGTPFDVTGEVLPPYPLSSIAHSVAVVHRDGNVFAEDKITRRALTFLYDKPVFHMDLPRRLGLIGDNQTPRGSFYVPEVDAQYFFFRYHGSTAVEYQGASETAPGRLADLPYARYSFIDILNGTVPAAKLEGKIVLVGSLSRENSDDFAFTPYSKNSFANPKLIVHANILDSIIHDNGVIRAPNWLNWLITFMVIAWVVFRVLVSKPLHGVFATLGLGVGFVVVAQYLFGSHSIWLRASQPLVGLFLGYYLVVPYRLIREYKKRWDYQRKNELMVQVEELKTNFLSLVTHDLKTPVARIQGLAEVLLRKSSERLLERDKESLFHIIDSTDELNRFITSILELSKVESSRLKLNLESRDVNQLIERSVEGFRAQARAKMIRITANLEPMFPIKIDAPLISKVVNNLIDNALKYSPAGSEILIETRETENRVEISVTDQGIGMSEEEINSLFTRFYRAKNDTTTQISGTGLGLYLTKYFVEAHSGAVHVTSSIGQGSKFTIQLPLELTLGLTTENPLSKLWKKKENSHV